MKSLVNTHDLSLGDWGPYTKKYMGISHVANNEMGLRFDLSVYASLYRRRTDIPNVMWESGYYPWESAPDFSFYSYRQELEWKDKLYTDISFSRMEEDCYQISCHCVNNGSCDQNIVLNYMAYMTAPTHTWGKIESLETCPGMMTVCLPSESFWIDALEYDDLKYGKSRPTDNLVADGLLRGEKMDSRFVNGSGIGCHFGAEKGDRVSYSFRIPVPLKKGVLIVRYRNRGECSAGFQLTGDIQAFCQFVPGEDFQLAEIPLGETISRKISFQLVSEGTSSLEIDGFILIEDSEKQKLHFEETRFNPRPHILKTSLENSLILKYENSDRYYGIFWQYPYSQVREIENGDLDSFMRYYAHDHVNSVLRGDGKGHYLNIFMRPVFLKPNESRFVYGLVTAGTLRQVEENLVKYSRENFSRRLAESRSGTFHFKTSPSGEKYRFSQEIMAATTLTNVVYPVYVKKTYIKHNTPGRWWNSLYTWDSGFCGLGLLEMDVTRAVECLNAYLTEPGDEQTAFIHHGSMVPVQFYLFLEIFNRTQDHSLLEFFYERLIQYYRFFCGKGGSSTIGHLESNILKTWDYFYNSGGWDDYPAQVYVHKNNLTAMAAPVCTTAHAIRIAKIMKGAAEKLNRMDDCLEYSSDIEILTSALMGYSWDDDSGYFGYVMHNKKGRASGILKTDSGENFNKGLDGLSPLISGICPDKMAQSIIDKLFDQNRFFTGAGLSTVDISASYYKKDGYWNGAVWMPHQWFFWKTMLDLGRPDLAFRIAQRGLELWDKEVNESYNCFEHFIVESGRGAGWHHFSGLSTPVLSWYQAYYGLGRLTVGFEIMIDKLWVNEDYTAMKASLSLGKIHENMAVVACLSPGHSYEILWNGNKTEVRNFEKGRLDIIINSGQNRGELIIKKTENPALEMI